MNDQARYNWQLTTDANGTSSFTATIFAPFTFRRGDEFGYVPIRPGWPHFSAWHSLEQWGLDGYFPRTRRAIARSRLYDDWPNTMGFIKQSVPAFLKSYFEVPPFYESSTVALSSDPTNGIGVEQINGIGFLNRYSNPWQTPEFWYRFGAWVFNGKAFRCPNYGDFIEDYASGSVLEANYYAYGRNAALGGSINIVGDDDSLPGENESDPGSGKIARPVMPMCVEHFNAVASIVNGFEHNIRDNFVSNAQVNLLNQFASNIGFGLTGVGGPRPRTQFCGWDQSLRPDITTLATSWGLTVLDDSAFPSPWATLITATQATSDGTTTFYGAAGSLLSSWIPLTVFPYDYRWVTIDDAKALYARLGAKFVMEELVAPGYLKIVDATTVNVDGAAVGGVVYTNGVGWTNDEFGDWVFIPDGYDYSRAPIRSDTTRTDCSLQGCYGGVYRVSYGDLDERLYFGGVTPGQTQGITGNKVLLYRRYGCQPVNVVNWPRNYANYEPEWASTGLNAMVRFASGGGLLVTPRLAVNDLEGQQPEVIALPTSDDPTAVEHIITTDFENAICVVWPLNVPNGA